MKLFQQLLVAPAALGLMAPLAVNAAEVNINDVANYATPSAEVNSSAQFSDVVPGDWAYTALQNLSESYGCVDNAYTQNLKTGQALTRYEAAALVNACLDGGLMADSEGLNEDAIRLSNEFGSEMAILKGRVDGLEYQIKELSAGTFSSTTKLSGSVNFTTGLIDKDQSSTANDKLHSTYEWKAGLSTSFNGKDKLVSEFEMGTATASPMGLDVQSSEGDFLKLTDLYYSFPAGDLSITAGPKLDGDEGLAGTAYVYSEPAVLGDSPYSLENGNGPGVAVAYAHDSGFNASMNLVADTGDVATTGMFTKEGTDTATFQLGYDGDNFGGAFTYSDNDSSTDYGVGLYFQPEGFPSISGVVDTSNTDTDACTTGNGLNCADKTQWVIGIEGDVGPGTFGFGVGTHDVKYVDANGNEVTGATSGNATLPDKSRTQELLAYEIWYDYPVSDGITVTPIFFIKEQVNKSSDATGAAVNVKFVF